MNILVLNGSPHAGGNTSAMVTAFVEGAAGIGHGITAAPVGRMKIAGCIGCEYCRTEGCGKCIQEDDMQKVYPLLEEAEMLVLASPVYYHGFTGQLQCAISRIYALDKPLKLTRAAIILSSGSDNVYSGIIYEYQNSFLDYMGLEDTGLFTAYGSQNKSERKLNELREFGQSLK